MTPVRATSTRAPGRATIGLTPSPRDGRVRHRKRARSVMLDPPAATTFVAAFALRHTAARLASAVHATVLVVALAVGSLVRPPDPVWFGAAMVVLAGWTVVFCVVALRHGLSSWLVAGDTLITATICVSLGPLVPVGTVPNGGGWVSPVIASTLLTIALTQRLAATVGLGLILTGCYLLGAGLASELSAGFGQAWTSLIQITVLSAVMTVIRRAGHDADRLFTAEQRAGHDAEVDRARRADERTQLRMIHATALATLTMIGSGSVASSPSRIRRWAAADLAALRSMSDQSRPARERTRLDQTLLEVVGRHRGQLRISYHPTPCQAPPEVVDALSQAAAEAVANAARHSGADEVTLTLGRAAGVITVTVGDRGRGFDPGPIPRHRYGVRESIIGAVEAVGGAATVDSAAGAGCRWTLVWPAASAPEPAATPVVRHFERGALIAAFVIGGLWHVLNDGMGVAVHWTAYRPPHGGAVSAALWTGYTVIGLLAAARLTRNRPAGRWFAPVAAAILVGGVAVNVVICTGPGVSTWTLIFGNANWAVGVSGWIGILVLWRGRAGGLVALFAANLLVEVVALQIVAPLDRPRLAQWIAAAYGITMLQVVFVVGLRFLQRSGDGAARAERRQNRAHAVRQAANAVHADRRQRYAEIGAAAADLLADLAAGRADHGDATTRHRASVAAARMRRLLAERDDVTDQLLHELRACADVAGRRGVAVDLVAVGTFPPLTVGARRELTETPARLLATARSWARVTVAASTDEVSVGVVVDGVLAEAELAGLAEIQVGREGEGLWLETIWRR